MSFEKIYQISEPTRRELIKKVPQRKKPVQIEKQQYTRTIWKPLLHRWAAILCSHATSLPICEIDYGSTGRDNFFDFRYKSRLEIELTKEAEVELLQIKSTLQLLKEHPILRYDGYHRSQGIMAQAILFGPFERGPQDPVIDEVCEPHPLAIYLRRYGLPKATSAKLRNEYQKYIQSGLIANVRPESAHEKLSQGHADFYKDYTSLVVHMIRQLPLEVTEQEISDRLKHFDQIKRPKAKKFFLKRIIKILKKAHKG